MSPNEPGRAYRKVRTGFLAIALAALVLILSPVPLLLLDAVDVDWVRLSAIGQSYTAAATLLSGAALLAIALSLRLQAKQASILQGQAIRQFQYELLRVAMSDPLYASVVPIRIEGPSHDEYRRYVYLTQWIRHFEFLHLAEEASPASTEYELRMFFEVIENRSWWEAARPGWLAGTADMGERRREFVRIIERAYASTATPTP